MHVAYATFLRNWTVTLRAYPWSFFIGSLLTSALVVGVGYLGYTVLTEGGLSPDFERFAGTGDYLTFLILGVAAYRFVVRMMLAVSRALITERREGMLESLLLVPSSRLAYFVGVGVHATVMVAAETLVLLALAAPFGLDLSRVAPVTLLVVLSVSLVGIFGLSLVLGALMLATGDTYISQNTLFATIALVSGFMFPVAYLPDAAQWLGRALPVTWAVEAMRAAALQGASLTAVAPGLAVAGLLGLGYAYVGFQLLVPAQARALEATS